MKSKQVAAQTPLDNRPEVELVALARRKDEAAVRELIRRCNQQLFRTARGILHNDAEAEDVVQAAYVSAFTKLEGFRGEAAFVTWLTRITMNEAYSRRRRQNHIVHIAEYRKDGIEGHKGDGRPMTPPPSTTPETELGRTEVRRFLEQAIDALPEPFRLTYVLRDVQELTTREVADILGIKAVTVKTRLFRAHRLLRAELSRTLAQEFTSIFPFDGARCVRMSDRVVGALADQSDY